MDANRKKYMLIVFVALFVFGLTLITVNKFFFSGNALHSSTNSTNAEKPIDPEDENYFKYSRMFSEAYHILKREFYNKRKVTAKNLFYGAIKGMLNNLDDPYSTFMDPRITEEFQVDMNAQFGGLGIRIDIRDKWLTVISPIEDTPAWRVGLKPNDKIIEIEGKSTRGITVMEAVTKLRGKPGTKVEITISRQGIDPFPVVITRAIIKLKTIKSDTISYKNKKYGYIKIIEFSMPTADDFKKHLKNILKKNPDGILIDLRNNPGGLLSVVVNCADNFLDEGLVVYTRGRMAENNSDYYADKRNTIVPKDMPLVVLINQGSASASEIFAGAIKDTHRGVIVGMKSFGKGSVQKTFVFQEDGSLVKYTVAKYFTPSGFVIDHVGLQPDIEEKIWYEKLSDNERNDLIKIQTTNFIAKFVKKNRQPGTTAIKTFHNNLTTMGYDVTLKSTKWLVQNKLNENKLPKLFDIENDEQLSKALDVVKNYEDYKKPLKYYNDAKD